MEKVSERDDCQYCGGAGIVHPMKNGVVQYSVTIPCSCRKNDINKKRIEAILKTCAFPPFAQNMNLNNFKQYNGVIQSYEDAKEMADNPGKLCWLAILGLNGIGKTHLGIAVCKKWIDAGIPARYALTSLLLDELREGFKKENDDSYAAKFDYYCRVPLLMLDDFGIESKTSWVQEKLETLIDYRLMNNLSLIITSNLSIDEMPMRISSRLERHPNCKISAMKGNENILREVKYGMSIRK